jgi:L-asparagine transporter-like permease
LHQQICTAAGSTINPAVPTDSAAILKRTLEQALALASPRIVPRPTTLLSTMIHLSVVVLWLLLFARAFFLQGVVAWSTGIAYVVYDTLLLVFVTVKTLPLMRSPTPRTRAACRAWA